MDRENVESILRALRRVNLQGSFLGQTVAVRFGLSESDIETLEELIEMGATTAGRLSEITGLTSGAVTRVIDRLEQAGYVRRVPDAADRRRVVVEVIPEKIAAIRSTLDRVSRAGADQMARYTDAQLALIADFLTKMEEVTRTEAETLRETPVGSDDQPASWEHTAPIGGLTEARLVIRSGLTSLRLRPGPNPGELYRASFEGSTPQVRVRDGRVLVQFKGIGWDWRGRSATFALNTGIPWTVDLVGGIQHLEADLRRVQLRSLTLTGGIERTQLELGQPAGEVLIRLVGGVKTLRIERPSGVPVRLSAAGGIGRVTLDGAAMGAKGGETTLAAPGWAEAQDRVDVAVVGGSKSIEVVARPG
jgi:DNA-binding MarR family transcriptional regulator